MNFIIKAIGKVAFGILAAALTEKVLAALVFNTLERFAKRSDNGIDDQVVADVKESYYNKA